MSMPRIFDGVMYGKSVQAAMSADTVKSAAGMYRFWIVSHPDPTMSTPTAKDTNTARW